MIWTNCVIADKVRPIPACFCFGIWLEAVQDVVAVLVAVEPLLVAAGHVGTDKMDAVEAASVPEVWSPCKTFPRLGGGGGAGDSREASSTSSSSSSSTPLWLSTKDLGQVVVTRTQEAILCLG